mmetsp:Transcript_21806/g.73379  ORF Transcript_21806/g.73379 Transcript_21806/m.73379 type:complete len:204 (+) Transcript_21806:225-836(+)
MVRSRRCSILLYTSRNHCLHTLRKITSRLRSPRLGPPRCRIRPSNRITEPTSQCSARRLGGRTTLARTCVPTLNSVGPLTPSMAQVGTKTARKCGGRCGPEENRCGTSWCHRCSADPGAEQTTPHVSARLRGPRRPLTTLTRRGSPRMPPGPPGPGPAEENTGPVGSKFSSQRPWLRLRRWMVCPSISSCARASRQERTDSGG